MDLLLKDHGDGADVVMRDALRTLDCPAYIDVWHPLTLPDYEVAHGRFEITDERSASFPVWATATATLSLVPEHYAPVWAYSWQIVSAGEVYYALPRTYLSLDPVKTPDSSVAPWTAYYGPNPPAEGPNIVPGPLRAYETDNADIHPESGIGNAIYISLFTGPSWQDLLKPSTEVVPGAGEFERLLGNPISIGSMQAVKSAAETQLSWLVTQNVVSSLNVEVSNPRVGYVSVDVTATQPNGTAGRYRVMWDQQTQRETAFLRNP